MVHGNNILLGKQRRQRPIRRATMVWQVIGLTLIICACCDAEEARDATAAATPVSMVSLIANPKVFDGKHIRINGIAYVDPRFRISAIFLTREDKVWGNGLNGIYLYLSNLTPKTGLLNDRFVVVEGIFHSDDKGHLDSFQGSLTDVNRIEALRTKIE